MILHLHSTKSARNIMNRNILVLLILFASINISRSQNTGAYDDGSRDYYSPNEILSISASPLALIDTYNGSAYKLGVSFRPVYWMRLSADAGGYLKQFSNTITLFDGMSGYHFRSSIGIPSGALDNDIGFGLSYYYKRQAFSYEGRTVTDPMDYIGNVTKFAHSYNAYISGDVELSSRFYIELRAEVGVRYREITNSHSHLVRDTDGWVDSWFSGRIINQKRFIPNFNISVRLNYSIINRWSN